MRHCLDINRVWPACRVAQTDTGSCCLAGAWRRRFTIHRRCYIVITGMPVSCRSRHGSVWAPDAACRLPGAGHRAGRERPVSRRSW